MSDCKQLINTWITRVIKPDWWLDNRFLYSKNLKSLLKISFSKILLHVGTRDILSKVWYYLFIILLMDLNNICSFPWSSKYTSSHRVSNYQSRWMSNRVSAKLNDSKRNIIMAMCLIYIQGSYYFDNIWFTESYWLNAFLRQVSKFTRQDTVI